MKKERIFTGLGLAALIMAASVSLAGCENPAGDGDGSPIDTGRYATVPVRSIPRIPSAAQSAKSSRAVGDSDSYVLASSGIGKDDEDNDVYYYLYYLGYVKNVPIAYKTSYQYDGRTPITITFEKSWVNEETITKSTTQTKEQTTSLNTSTTVEAGVEAKAGAIFTEMKAWASVAATFGTQFSNSISTSNTLETAQTKANGETEGISATIGEHGEEPGTYRYALFGLTDVYCLFAVDPETHRIISIDYTTCARESTYAWGIDFDPSAIAVFGKTGGGALLEIPDIEFANIEAPTDILEGPPEPPPPETVNDQVTLDIGQIIGGATRTGGGDDDINSKNGRKTNWEFEITGMALKNQREDGTYDSLEIQFVYTVMEGQSNWTELRITKAHLVDFGSYKALALREPLTERRTGTISDEQHGWVYQGSWSNGLLNNLYLKIDDSGDDKNNIGFRPTITVRFVKKNN
jgi:hypothetical protein